MPRKIRELIADLRKAGFENRGGKGSHRTYRHLATGISISISGKAGDDAKLYQEKDLRHAIEQSKG